RAAASLPAGGDGGLLQRRARALSRDFRREPAVQEGVAIDVHVPQRRMSVVADRGIRLRYLLDPNARQELSVEAPHPRKTKPRGGAPGFFVVAASRRRISCGCGGSCNCRCCIPRPTTTGTLRCGKLGSTPRSS